MKAYRLPAYVILVVLLLVLSVANADEHDSRACWPVAGDGSRISTPGSRQKNNASGIGQRVSGGDADTHSLRAIRRVSQKKGRRCRW